ncbi:hypothetical protein RND81_11G212600 [Saponaria officinalis]|uniref:S-protein homolog n=1 Tax=Saponaria officinalis TaxID=3572 RepID=A0AAW1HRB8_SAPOF
MKNVNTLLKCLTLITIATMCINIEAFPFFKGTKFHVIIMNLMSQETLNTHCISDYQEQNFSNQIAPNTNLTWSFTTQLFGQTNYTCDLSISKARVNILAYSEDEDFVDDGCGGRHCFWKVARDGIYLYHIHKQQFFLKYRWGPKALSV